MLYKVFITKFCKRGAIQTDFTAFRGHNKKGVTPINGINSLPLTIIGILELLKSSLYKHKIYDEVSQSE